MLMEYLKIFITKLKNSYVYKQLINNYFLLAFFILLILITLNHIIGIVLLIGYSIYLLEKDKILLNLSLILSFLIIGSYFYLEFTMNNNNIIFNHGKVVEIENFQDYQKITIKNGNKMVILYDKEKIPISLANVISFKGEKLDVEKARVPNGFDYSEYLKHQKVIGVFNTSKIEVIKSRFTFMLFREKLSNYIDKYFSIESKAIIKALIIGDSSGFDDQFNEALIDNGILHLFAISGSHIIIFILLIDKLLSKFKIVKKDIFICFFLFVYLFITNFSPSVIRAVLTYYLIIVNKILKLNFSSLDIVSIIFIILIIYNPYYMYDLGFILSFLVVFIIILFFPLLKNFSSLIQVLFISVSALIITLPITVNINYEINILSPITNVLFIFLSDIILPITIIVVCFYPLDIIYKYIVISFNRLNIFISKLFIIKIGFPNFSIYSIIIYYSLLISIIILYHNKRIKYYLSSIILFFLLVISNLTSFSISIEVYFLDLKNGDSIFIKDHFNQCNALIDTGDGSNNVVTNFLKSKGINKLDYLFITHEHLDHNGELNLILSEILVNKIVIHAYYSSVVENSKLIKVNNYQSFKCGNIIFEVLGPKQNYFNENDNSLVIYSNIGEYKFLFLGDITKNREAELLNYNFDVDVIKIAHHGSSTSTNEEFISQVLPKYAIIETGRIKKFGFPHQNTINILKRNNVVIYRTDYHSTIIYKYFKDQSIFETMQ